MLVLTFFRASSKIHKYSTVVSIYKIGKATTVIHMPRATVQKRARPFSRAILFGVMQVMLRQKTTCRFAVTRAQGSARS